MLFDTGTGKRTGAVAVSLTLQTLAVAILFLIPLLYSDRLPLIRPLLPITIPLLPPLPEPPPVETHQTSATSRPSLAPPRVFHANFAPTSVPTMQATISDDSASFPISIGNAPAIGLRTNIGILIGPATAPVARPVAEPAKVPEKPHPVGGDVQAAKLIRQRGCRCIPSSPGARAFRVPFDWSA